MGHGERVPGLAADEWSGEVSALLEGTVRRVATLEEGGGGTARTKPLHILTVMAHNPALLAPFLPWASALAIDGSLPRRDAELLALRVAARFGSDFEWGHHVVYGRAAGMDDADLDRIAHGPDAPGWSDHEDALLRAADELLDEHDISEPVWQALRAHYTEAALVEIPLVVGQYTMLSMLANGVGVQLEPGHEPAPVNGVRRPLV